MNATHLLLGRPWQFDKKALHDGFLNTYAFIHGGKRVTLLPMSPREILQDHNERSHAKAIEAAQSMATPAGATPRLALVSHAPPIQLGDPWKSPSPSSAPETRSALPKSANKSSAQPTDRIQG